MDLKISAYLDKMRACWLGKNIGGTLGAPFESQRGVIDLDYYTHDLSLGVLPNDDLDLQLAFLIACEAYGKNVNSEVLANYWLTHIFPDVGEYGMGKRNLRAGILPSASGKHHNSFGQSNGAWIRSEIWACLNPGHPELAAHYAYEDACVDHFGEGIYAEVFCAAIQSAAFVESDMELLIDIGLSYIPADCGIARVVEFVRKCAADKSLNWKIARKKLLQAFPSSFGSRPLPGQKLDPEVPFGPHGYDAPANIGIVLLGHYYGGGDFSRAICITAGCCEDADCTTGTLGALYGIIGGTASIHEKWLAPIGDEIKTKYVDTTKLHVAKTVTELTERILHLMPVFLHARYWEGKMQKNISIGENGELTIHAKEGRALACPAKELGYRKVEYFRDTLYADRMCIRRESPFFEVRAITDTLDLEEGKPFVIDLDILGKYGYFQRSDWNTVILHLPAEWETPDGREVMFQMDLPWHKKFYTISFVPRELKQASYEVMLEIRLATFPSRIYIPLTLTRMLKPR
ncbi:MAG: ADP-ribosylglycohydrolase family protein [Clostridia bacterium]|nr:ADP-ribosylglycohydrolase family protein [Clostridia bacterium]